MTEYCKQINDDNYEIVRTINKDLYDFSKKAVAGKNDKILRENIEKIKNWP